MADFDEIRKKLDAASQSVAKISKDLSEANRFSGTFVQTFSDLASMKTVGGTIWSVIDRFSGQGFYFLQKNVRGFMVLFRLATQIEKERYENAEKLNKRMEQQGEFLQNFLTIYESIDALERSSNERLNKTILGQNTINKLKLREMGYTQYISEARADAVKGIRDQLELERKMVDTEKARANLSSKSKGIIGDNFKTGFFGNPELESRVVQLLNISDEITDMTNTLSSLEGEDKEKMNDRIKQSQTMFDILKDELGGMGVKVDTGIGPLSASIYDISKIPSESFFTKLNKDPKGTIAKLFLPSAELVKIFKRSLMGWLVKKNFNKIFRMATLALPLFGKIGLAIGMLGLLVYLLHKSGFIDSAMEFITGLDWKSVLDGLYMFVGGILDVVVGFFQLFHALFTGGSFMDEVLPALKKILGIDGEEGGGLAGIFVGALQGFGGLVINSLVAIVGGAVLGIVGSIERLGGILIDKGKEAARKVSGAAPAFGVLTGIGTGARIGGMAGGIPGAIAGGLIGGFVGGVGGLILKDATMASGGTVGKGGMFLVGEEGPELVNLPMGSKVYSNPQTRNMMAPTTINVSVNGRVGATDSELDDIARRIGQKISLEMNRYNNNGYRA